MKSTHELKAIAKENLLGNYKIVIPAILIISLYSILLNNLAASIYQHGNIVSILLHLLFLIISAILLQFFSIGKSYLFLNLSTHRNFRINDIYQGFRMNSKNTLPLCTVYALVIEICISLPAFLFQRYYQISASTTTLLLISGVFITGMLLALYFTLTYSQVFYLTNDFPSLSYKDLYKLSKRLMHGNRGKLLYLQISFIPWFLLSVVTFGIALLWLAPYVNATKTLFYLELIESQKK